MTMYTEAASFSTAHLDSFSWLFKCVRPGEDSLKVWRLPFGMYKFGPFQAEDEEENLFTLPLPLSS